MELVLGQPLELDPMEQRVLGSLMEKEITVPATYPMTINAVRTACNQTSSRDPVADYDEQTVNETLKRLRDRELVVTSWSGSGQRSVKFAQTLSHRRQWSAAERALMTVLLLRGPQPAGALKTRSDRLHAFGDRAEVEQTLRAMAAAEPPLVRELPRRAGQQDPRWIHLLGPVEAAAAEPASPTADPELVLRNGSDARDRSVRASYNAIAGAYADSLTCELDVLPFERWLLDRVAELAAPDPIMDAGCGPGHVTAYLAARGAAVTGLDLSEQMITQARQRYPNGSYEVGDLRQLIRPPHSVGWGAVLAWYSMIHLATSELPAAFASLVRALRSGGWLLVGCHAGTDVVELDEWFDSPVELGFVQHTPAEVVPLLRAAGLVDIEWYHRGQQRNEQTQRLYVLGRLP